MYTRLVPVILVVVCLGVISACGIGPASDKRSDSSAGDRLLGDSSDVSKEQAIAAVTKLTPLKTVQKTELTPPGPRMWVVYGADESGRPGAAWVWKAGKVEGYTFLDKGISGTDAVAKVKTAGFTPFMQLPPVLVRPAHPAWYVTVKGTDGGQGVVLVDLATGEVMK